MLTVILTGGKSLRMGRDKASLPTSRGPMSLALAERYAVLGPVAFSVDRPGRFDCGDFPELPDVYPGCGPFNGIYSAFLYTREDTVFLTATDMPLGDADLVRELAARKGEACACAIQWRSGFIEPLFALYDRRCFPLAEECLQTGLLSLQEVFRRLPVRLVPEEELSGWDLERVLCNINTPETYRRFFEAETGGGEA